jgi:lysophospholipase L1-like esterase
MAGAHIIFWRERNAGIPNNNPDNRQMYRYRVVAEGDSWYTINGTAAGELPWNLLMSLDFPDSTILVNLAQPGDTMRSMSRLCNSSDLRYALSARYGYQWDAILLSAGGNDLADYASLPDDQGFLKPAAARGAINGPQDYVYENRLQDVLDYVTHGYRVITGLRDAPGSGCVGAPIVVHTYDRVTPRNAPAFIGPIHLGPWLYKSFTDDRIKVPEADWIALSDYLLNKLRDAINALGGELANFHVVDTFGVLTSAQAGSEGNNSDWLNEIHPNKGGYDKLAAKVSQDLTPLLGIQ